MQWLKQTFAVRFNLRTGRTGHRWGNRYWSEVLEGEPPEGAAAVDWKAVEAEAEAPTAADMRRRRNGVRPQQVENGAETPFSPEIPLRAASPPAYGVPPRPCGGRIAHTPRLDTSGQKRPQARSAPGRA
jgi:hypothetical protein